MVLILSFLFFETEAVIKQDLTQWLEDKFIDEDDSVAAATAKNCYSLEAHPQIVKHLGCFEERVSKR